MKKYSIILPVRNGGEYVKECVNSILAQTLDNFNLHVLDNCSTDGTLQWIQSLNDKRIIYYPSGTPLTIEQNWTRIAAIPKNEYMTLLGHDDILQHEYLETVDHLISKFPDASLYQTAFAYIDAKGQQIRDCKEMVEKQTGPEFLQSVLKNQIDIVGSGFMMRSKDYDDLGGIPPRYPNLLFADFELWISLAAISYIATSAVTGFYFRLHQSTTSVSSDIKYQAAFEKFVYYLQNLKQRNSNYKDVIDTNAAKFLMHYCQSLSHRLLKTPQGKRKDESVIRIVQKGKEYYFLLTGNKNFNPLSNLSILMARIIDSNLVTQNLFLFAKRIYSKPVLK